MPDDNDLPPQIPVTEEMRIEIHGALAEIDPAQMAIISRMTPAQRGAHGLSMCESVLRIAVGRARQLHPDWDDMEAQRGVLNAYYALESSPVMSK